MIFCVAIFIEAQTIIEYAESRRFQTFLMFLKKIFLRRLLNVCLKPTDRDSPVLISVKSIAERADYAPAHAQ